jgi:outer membrane protein TolC
MRKYLVVIGVLWLQIGMTQNEQPINLDKVLELSGANNLTIKEYQLKKELALAHLEKTKEWWLPNVYLGINTHALWGASMNTDGKYALDVKRDNLWSGLGIDATWDIAEGMYQKKVAEINIKAIEQEGIAERNKEILSAIEAYYDLAAAQLYYQAYENLAFEADKTKQQLQLQVEAGLQYESDLLLAKSNLNHLKVQMLQAKASYIKQSATLVQKLNLDPSIKLVSVDSVMLPLEFPTVLEKTIYESAYQNRAEFKAIDFSIKALEIEKSTITKGLFIPELSLNAYGSFNGRVNGDVIPLLPLQFPNTKQLYPTAGIDIGIKWSVPIGQLIFDGDLKKNSAKKALELNKIEQMKASVNAEIIAASQAIENAKEQMDMAKEGGEFAKEALSQCIQRQHLGTARPFEILQSQEIYIEAQLDYLNALALFNKAQYQLFVAKGNNL